MKKFVKTMRKIAGVVLLCFGVFYPIILLLVTDDWAVSYDILVVSGIALWAGWMLLRTAKKEASDAK